MRYMKGFRFVKKISSWSMGLCRKLSVYKPLCLTILTTLCGQTFAATITASDTTQAAVQKAVDSAVDGDVVLVPAGSSTWPYRVNINKGIRLIGAGIDRTTISLGYPVQEVTDGVLLNLNPNGKYLEINGFTFSDVSAGEHWNGMVVVNHGSNWRICSNKFKIYFNGVKTWDDTCYGLIDHCAFVQMTGNGSANGVSMNGEGIGEASWNRPPAFGSADYVYIEDCTFSYLNQGNGAYDAYAGARYVFRYNSVTNTWLNHHGCDSGGTRSTHSFEIYNNYVSSTIGLAWFLEFRGGTGVIFSNKCQTASTVGNSIVLDSYRSAINYWSPGYLDPWGYATGFNPFDGNSNSTGYPVLDQIGRTSPTVFETTRSIQTLSPLYCWSNTFNANSMSSEVHLIANSTPSVFDHLKPNRDYFDKTPKPGYKPLAYPHPLIAFGNRFVNQPPVAVATAKPKIGPTPLTVAFSSVGSYDPEGVALSYNWNFGDDTISTAANPTNTYRQPGTFFARLTVSDGLKVSSSSNITIVVSLPSDQPIIAAANASVTNGIAPLNVVFSSAGSFDPEGVPLSFNWNFGDGTVSATANPSHTYQSAGVYAAQLTVSDGTNKVSSPIMSITVAAGQ
jgi:PKD repeat protein